MGLTVTAVVATLGCGGGGGEDSGIQLNGVAFGQRTDPSVDAFVAVGDSDRIFVNVGNGWTPFLSGVASLNSVVWSASLQKFVAVGDGGTIAAIDVSIVPAERSGQPPTAKVDIVPQASRTTVDLRGVATGDGGLIAVGAGGTILASTDAVTWVPRISNLPNGESLNGVAFGESGEVVAVGESSVVVTSTNAGVDWVPSEVGFPDQPDVVIGNLNGVAHGSRGWVVAGEGGVLLRADRPGDWTLQGYRILPDLFGVAFVQGLYTVVGENGRILTSPDGITYGQSVSNSGQFLYGVAYGNGNFFVVGSGGRALQSVDGVIYLDRKV